MKSLTLVFLFAFSASAALNVGTYNIRNFDKPGSPTNKDLLKSTILESSPDIMAVQEIFDARSFRSFVAKELKGYGVELSRCGGGGNQKLGFVYRKSSLKLLSSREDRRLVNPIDSSCGSLRPALIGAFEDLKNGKKFMAVSVHLKAGGSRRDMARRSRQYGILLDMIRELSRSEANVLVMGDFNTTGFDSRNGDYLNFKNMLEGAGARTSAERVACTSYWPGRDYHDGIEEASTLDHIVYTKGFYQAGNPGAKVGGHCRKAACQDAYKDVLGEGYRSVSDHCPVTLTFK